MKVKVWSDIHLEFWNYNDIQKVLDRKFPVEPEDKNTILCCAGDVGLYSKYASTYKPFFQIMSKRFKHVVVVPGNHSYYNSSLWGGEKEFWKDKVIPKNVHYLDNGVFKLWNVVFIGSILWTDFDNSNPLSMFKANNGMNDFRIIKKGNVIREPYASSINYTLSPEDTVVRHKECRAFIEEQVEKYKDKKIVIVTHHGCTQKSVPPLYKGDDLNPAYHSNLEDLMLNNTQIKYWLHGHTHTSRQYDVGETKVIVNPFGYYYQEENKAFDPNLTFEI